MRSLVVAIGLLAFAAHGVDAKPRKPKPAKTEKHDRSGKRDKHGKRAAKRVAKSETGRSTRSKQRDQRDRRDQRGAKQKGKRVAHALRHRVYRIEGPVAGQSLGVPWAGRLIDPVRLPPHDGYFLRRPWRAFGTQQMVETIFHAVGAVREQLPDVHVLAIGDLSSETGGRISDHSSHQSGRDVDLGLYFTQRPAGYPEVFVSATAETLDAAATYALVEELAASGRVHMMFLDFKVQGWLVQWARANGVAEERFSQLFQYPHGRGASVGLVRHEPNHMDHIHVRFRCQRGDIACR